MAELTSTKSITWRSLLLGTIAVIAICGLTPLNDLILNDTSLNAGFMPLGAVLILFLLVVGINAPLHRWFPRAALSTGELAIIVLMTLIACSLPNWGVMRFFIPTPVAPFHVGAFDEQFWRTFVGMDLPKWLFPVDDIKTGRTSTVAQWFYNSTPGDQPAPYRAWIVPLFSWGIFVAAMFATLAAIARLVLEQWAANERLPFPLVQVQSALIEPPRPGFGLNAMFRSPVLWIGLGGVLFIHLLSCLNAYSPRHFPRIPLQYDLTALFSEEPFIYLRSKLKKGAISFTVIGVTYFIRSRAAFSLWATFIIVNLVDMQAGMRQQEMQSAAWADQHLGASIAFVGGMLWIGRHHWARVLRDAFGLTAPADRRYGLTFWVAGAGTVVMLGWLIALGVHWWMAAMIVLFILAAHLIVARIVAETGLPFYRTTISTSQVYTNCPPKWFSARDIYFASVYSVLGPLTTRDSITTFATTGLGVTRNAGVEKVRKRYLGGVIAWSLIVGFFVAAFATLHGQYAYPTPASEQATPVRNFFGAEWVPRRDVAVQVDDHARGRFSPKQHNPALHMSIGFIGTVALQIASLRWASWPFLPVGYVAAGHGAFVENAWLSIFIGWCAQVLIVRFGGASLFQKARPFFVGIIFGECLAAGIWLIVNAIVVFNGGESQSVKFLL